LLVAAGRVSKPTRAERRELAKAFRRRDRAEMRGADAQLLDAAGIRALRAAPVFRAPARTSSAELPRGAPTPRAPSEGKRAGAAAGPELKRARKCYVCKAEYSKPHFFYDQLCTPCAELNYEKRFQTASLVGKVALITGGRVKIGYQAALLLLRAGARAVVSTRFPNDAAERFAHEADFDAWRDRLEIYGLDLRHTPSVERFAHHLTERLDRLDFIINNACQTVRRPTGFYAHLVAREARTVSELAPREQPLVRAYDELRARSARPALATSSDSLGQFGDSPDPSFMGLDAPAILSQIACTDDDRTAGGFLPEGRLDADLQQVDLRPLNSWRLTLAEVPTVELLEVQLVNLVAPFILNGRLKPLMLRQPSFDKHIVNVSAVEGQFYRNHKTDKHPHTNMAKAALNMMTRTSAVDYARDGIHMNSVDTGWVTDEDPAAIAERKRDEHGFHPPLDIVDGAARICDPIFVGYLTGRHPFGQFFKDYAPAAW
jgi:NAD(P)-dependent dehydrogenase (short-subunit alcohol dehydrogenase family)